MKKILSAFFFSIPVLLYPALTEAASNAEVGRFARDSLSTIIILASLASVFFLIHGGYIYITSTGKPEALEEAKKIIKRALIGFVIVIGASVFSSLLNNAFTQPSAGISETTINLSPIVPAEPDSSLTQILLNAISGFLQNIVQSATKPITDGIIWFLSSTPALSTNSVVFNFWLVMAGITNSLFVVIVALLGLQVMSASSFGFEEVSLRQLFPRIALAFLLANTSIFLIDWLIALSQTLVSAVLRATGGINEAWILNAFDPLSLITGSTALITLIFMVIFILLAVILLLFYISRLMILAFGAVISPLVCLLWLIPKATDFAENLFKTYLVTIFIMFVHVVIIQLASSFLTIPSQDGANPFISVLVGIALFSVLLKSTATTMQVALASQTTGAVKKIGGQLFNVLSPASGSQAAALKTAQTKVRNK